MCYTSVSHVWWWCGGGKAPFRVALLSASLCSSPSQNPKITRILLAYPPTSFHSERKVWGVVDLGRPEGAEQLVKTLNGAKCQQWGG